MSRLEILTEHLAETLTQDQAIAALKQRVIELEAKLAESLEWKKVMTESYKHLDYEYKVCKHSLERSKAEVLKLKASLKEIADHRSKSILHRFLLRRGS